MLKNFDKITQWHFFGMFIIMVGMLTFYVYRDYLLLDKLFLFKDSGSDTLNGFYPRLVHLADYLRTDGLPRWSFNRGMGQSLFPSRLGVPFDWPLFAMGSSRLAYGIAYMEAVKVILGGAIFYCYLRLMSSSVYVCMVGGLLYAFSGYMIVGTTYYVFSTEAVYLALLLYAFERYLQQGVWWPFPLVIALIASGVYAFDLYTHAVFFVFYGVLRYHDCRGWHLRAMGRFFLKVAGLGLMGAGIASVFLFAGVQEMLQSQRVGGKASAVGLLQDHAVFSFAGKGGNIITLMHAFSNNITGVGSNYQGGWYNEAPLLYCGLISLLLAPQVFIFLGRRQRILYGAVALAFLLPVVFPYFRYAFWLFSGNYYRVLSLFIALVAVLYALKALGNILASSRINAWLLVGTLAVLLGGLLYPYDPSGLYNTFGIQLAPDPMLKWTAAGFLCLYTLLTFGISRKKTRVPAATLLLAALCVELAMTASVSVNGRPVVTVAEFHERVGYNDYSVDVLDYLKKNDKGFYRIDKTYGSSPAMHASLNDGMAQGYRGTTSYASFNNGSYIDFLDAVGLISEKTNQRGQRWLTGLVGQPILLSFASVKYLLTKNSTYTNPGFRMIGQVGNIYAVQNLSALPFGFTYDSYMSRAEFMQLENWQKDIALIKAAVLDPPLEAAAKERYQRLLAGDIGKAEEFKMQYIATDIQARQKYSLDMVSFSQNEIMGKIALDRERILFFTIPFDKGWEAKVDGVPAELLRMNIGFTGLMVAPGSHTIELAYQPTYWVAGWVASALSLLVFLLCLWKDKIRMAIGKHIKRAL